MRYYDCRSLFLSCLLGVTAGSGLLPLSPALVMVQASELGSQKPQEGVIKTCTGQRIDLGVPQLTDADLKALTYCGSEVMPQLLEALKAQDWKVKVIAAHTLGLLGTKAQSAIPTLSNLVQDENADVRFVAAQALGEIGTNAVVPALTKALQDKDENVRISAATAFQQIGGGAELAKPALIDALWDGNWYVRSRAAATISKLSLEERDIPKLIEPWRDGFGPDTGAIVSVMIAIDPHVRRQVHDVPLLFIKALENSDSRVRESTAIALKEIAKTRPGKVRLVEYTNALLRAIQDKDSQVRQEVYLALSSVTLALNSSSFDYVDKSINTDKSSLLAKIRLTLPQGLQDSDPNVRSTSIELLMGSLRIDLSNDFDVSTSIISPLLKLFKDSNPNVRRSVAYHLGYVQWSIDYGGNSSPIPLAQRSKLLPVVTSSFVQALYDQDEEVRLTAGARSNEKITLPILIEILQNKNSPVEFRRTAIATMWANKNILENRKSEYPVYLLKQALQDTDSGIRVNAALTLAEIKQLDYQSAANIFIEGLQANNPLIRLSAIHGLQQMCSLDAETQQVDQRRCLHAKSALKLLIDALKDHVKSIQYAAAFALADIEPKEECAIPILKEIFLKEYDYLVRGYAQGALAKIGSQA